VAGDDKETNETSAHSAKPPLPPRVVRALARAREAAQADHARRGGRALALFPLAVAVLLLGLMMPWATLPDEVPLPIIDERVIRDVARADDARAASAEATRLPADVLLVGTAVRGLNGAQMRGADEVQVLDARRQLDAALHDLGKRDSLNAELITLRAVQTRRFLDALSAWEADGKSTEDFTDLAASFVDRARDAGWVTDRHIVLDDAERRVMFKTVWNVLVGVDWASPLGLTLDEDRTLYAFYIKHPHPPESHRLTLDSERRRATTPEACSRVQREVFRQSELWLADKLKKLGDRDPSYPTAYALGVAYFHAGRSELASEAFAAFIRNHPDGRYALRARNHLKAILSGSGPS
jgi:hypothetical protein